MVNILQTKIRRTYNCYHYLYRCLLRFFLIGILVSLIMIPAYNTALRSVREAAVKTLQSDLHAGFQEFENTIQTMITHALIAANDNSISVITRTPDLMNLKSGDHYTLMLASEWMENFTFPSDMVANAYIVSNYNTIFLSSSIAALDRSDIYGTFYEIEGLTLDEWESSVLKSENNSCFFIPAAYTNRTFNPSHKSTKEMILHMIVPINRYGANPQKFFIYMLSTEWIFNRLTPSIEGTFTCLTARDGTVLATQNYSGDGDSAALLNDGGSHYTIIKETDTDTGLEIVLGIPKLYFDTLLAPTRQMLMVFILVIGLSAVILSFIMAIQQARPVSRTMELVERLNAQSRKKTGNEYDYIIDTIQKLDSQRQQYEEEIKVMNASVQSACLGRLLSGDIFTNEDIAFCRSILSLKGNRFLCAAVRINSDELTGNEPAGRESLHLMTELNDILADYLKEKLPYPCYSYNARYLTTNLLICLSDDASEDGDVLHRILADAVPYIRNCTRIPVCIGVGLPVPDIRSIEESAKNAQNALSFSDTGTPFAVFCSGDFRKGPVFSASESRKLSALIGIGDENGIEDFFTELSGGLHHNRGCSESEICQTFYGIRTAIESAAASISGVEEPFELPEYTAGMNAKKLLLTLKKPCLVLCAHQNAEHHQQKERQDKDVIAYIRANFSDCNLCATSIADRFKLAEKYVFTLVKQETGKSLGDFIQELRFEKAEKLLCGQTDISRIPECIGYNSVNTFYKAFKRNYGISPGQWRILNRTGEPKRSDR